MNNQQRPIYENPMTGGDADFVYNNLMTGIANNNQVNNLGSNV